MTDRFGAESIKIMSAFSYVTFGNSTFLSSISVEATLLGYCKKEGMSLGHLAQSLGLFIVMVLWAAPKTKPKTMAW